MVMNANKKIESKERTVEPTFDHLDPKEIEKLEIEQQDLDTAMRNWNDMLTISIRTIRNQMDRSPRLMNKIVLKKALTDLRCAAEEIDKFVA